MAFALGSSDFSVFVCAIPSNSGALRVIMDEDSELLRRFGRDRAREHSWRASGVACSRESRSDCDKRSSDEGGSVRGGNHFLINDYRNYEYN